MLPQNEQDTKRAIAPLVTANFRNACRLADLDQARALGVSIREGLNLPAAASAEDAAAALLAAHPEEVELAEYTTDQGASFSSLYVRLPGLVSLLVLPPGVTGYSRARMTVQPFAQANFCPIRKTQPADREAFAAEDKQLVAWADAFTAAFLGEPV